MAQPGFSDPQQNNPPNLAPLVNTLLAYKAGLESRCISLQPHRDLYKYNRESANALMISLQNLLIEFDELKKIYGVKDLKTKISALDRYFNSVQGFEDFIGKALREVFVALRVVDRENIDPEGSWRVSGEGTCFIPTILLRG